MLAARCGAEEIRRGYSLKQKGSHLQTFSPGALAVILMLAAMACSSSENLRPTAGAQPGTSATQAQSTASRQEPSAGGKAAGADDWEDEWEQTVAAARQEGKLVLTGPPGEVWRRALMTFEEDFPQIQVEYTGANSRDFWPRVFRERELGQYLWDLRVGGPDPHVYEARDEGILDPVRPLLLLPEVAEENKWSGGFNGLFVDKEHNYIAGFLAYASAPVFVNRDVVPETEFRSDQDLLDPQWKGKIVLQDPRGGAGLGSMTVLLAVYGEQFVEDLLSKQDVVVTSDGRQQAEWVIRGRYPIGIGVLPDQLLYLKQQGLAFNVQRLREGSAGLSVGFGGIQLLNRSPHPNAAKVYINWLLSQKAQENLAQTLGLNSRRLDVEARNPEVMLDPDRIENYVPHQYENFLPLRRRTAELAAQFLK